MFTDAPTDGDVPIVAEGVLADVLVDPDDHEVTRVAAADFAADVERVTGVRPEVRESAGDCSGTAVVVGTLGVSEAVETCLDAGGVDLPGVRGERESYAVVTVEAPLPGVDRAAVIAGSDRRGTAYGVYDLTREMGVSPWYWWADVPPADRDSVAVAAGVHREGPPDVTYRGVFLNDEDFGLRPWASETHAPDDSDRPGIGPTTYERLFELLLRLGANTVWPAMHPDTKAFYRYPEHAALADRYAIVVGTSHCEPMHRNNVDEWEAAFGEWNYATNAERVREYWRERVDAVADYENAFTLGMRGIHDGGMPGGDAPAERVELLQRVLDDQRAMLDAAHNRPVADVPQVFCPYKEVLALYREGLDVPEDVCLMWPDDSHGYLRELPTAAERERSGGSGVYYHLSYWGRPHDYLWLSSVPLGLLKAEMTRAYDAGARECWVANVGDLKRREVGTEYFLSLARDVAGVRGRSVESWLESWAAREFGAAHAAEVAGVLREYYRLAQSRKPEHTGWSTVYPDTEPDDPAFSATRAGDEARRRLDAYDRLADRADAVREALPPARRPAFFELVGYRVRGAAAMNRKHLEAARSRLYAGQGRASAGDRADAAETAHERIAALTDRYDELLGGKWEGVTSHHPRDLPAFDLPSVARVTPYDGGALGVVPEGRGKPVRGDEVRPPALPGFDPHVDRERFLDVYNRGRDPVEWTASASEPWVTLSGTGGTLGGGDDRRLWVGVDWDTSDDPTGASATVTVAGPGTEKAVRVEAGSPLRDPAGDFVEANGVAAMEAEHASRAVDGRRDGGGRAVGLPEPRPRRPGRADAGVRHDVRDDGRGDRRGPLPADAVARRRPRPPVRARGR